MNSQQRKLADIWLLIFDELRGDYATLCAASLVSKAWQSMALPALLHHVDISFHNRGRLYQVESDIGTLPGFQFWAADRPEFAPTNFLTRQRAFISLLMRKPYLAKYVRFFTWTILWKPWDDFSDDPYHPLDLQTWRVFGRLKHVTHLDLASLHHYNQLQGDEYIRQNPETLFPSAVHIRLLGCTYRGLVHAILTKPDGRKIKSLKLDKLMDEGPVHIQGKPLAGNDFYSITALSDEWLRQANIVNDTFPQQDGADYDSMLYSYSMWYAPRLLNQSPASLSDLTELDMVFLPLNECKDHHDYLTTFIELGKAIRNARTSLRHIRINVGESAAMYHPSGCRSNITRTNRRWSFVRDLTLALLEQILDALEEGGYPALETVFLKGFTALTRYMSPYVHPHVQTRVALGLARARDQPLINSDYLTLTNEDHHRWQ